jgi:two-component system CheB/CheR fusion protein
MFKVPVGEAAGRPMSLVIPAVALPPTHAVYDRLRRGETIPPYEVSLTRDGRSHDVSVAMSPLRNASSELIGVSVIFRDITELKRAQEGLRREVHEKDQFLAVLSHELRNPLAPLRTSLEILRHWGTTPEAREDSLLVMGRQLSHLTSLVDQLMDAARISSGKIVFDPEDLDLVEVVRATVADHSSLFQEAGIALEARLPASAVVVRGDRLRLSQAIGNLLTNAVKFTDKGGSVTVTLVRDGDAGAIVSVRDTGIGIEPGIVERLFRPFAQVPASIGRGRGGLGLGLALVRGVVESHGGKVEIRSGGLGRGADFCVRLPVQGGTLGPLGTNEPAVSHAAVPRRVLVIEDNADASESLKRLLTLWGHDVEAVADGAAALERVKVFRPEIVLCDLKLPGKQDGYAVAAAIRADPAVASPYLVALTGSGQPDDRERSQAAGFDRHLTKPADIATLRRLIDDLPRRRPGSQGRRRADASPEG